MIPPPNNLKAPAFQLKKVFPLTPQANEFKMFCDAHRKSRIHPLQTPGWCDMFPSCPDCMIDYLNHLPVESAQVDKDNASVL